MESFVRTMTKEVMPKVVDKLATLQEQADTNSKKFGVIKQVLANMNGRIDELQKELAAMRVALEAVETARNTPPAPAPAPVEAEPVAKPKKTRRKKTAAPSPTENEVDMDIVKRMEELYMQKYDDLRPPIIEGMPIDAECISAVEIEIVGGCSTAYMVSEKTGIPEEACQYVMDLSLSEREQLRLKFPIPVEL